MNVSLRWLRSLAPGLEADTAVLTERLAMLGAPVDDIIDLGQPLREVVVARVAAVRRHPNADRLSVCTVDAGTGELLAVVCGAPNVRAERFYPFIPEGGELPGGVRIRRAKIRGEESRGMLCSPRELGLGRDHEGILELEGTYTPGERFIDAVQLDDVRLVIDVTPNRPDLLSHIGVARELAPGGAASLVLPPFPRHNGAGPAFDLREHPRTVEAAGVRVTVEDAAGCPHYTGTIIRGVRVGPSPEWLASRLRAVGARPINNVVDATNYVLHELGQPMHAFDLDRLGDVVVVRQARAGEKLVTLDGEERQLAPGMLVIADAARPVALAGVMGGRDTEVSESTTDLFLETAIFGTADVRRTRRTLGMTTDASYRFERGVDASGVERAVRRAADLIVAVAGGTVAPEAASVRAAPPEPRRVRLRGARVEQVLGVAVPVERMRAYLEALGFATASGEDATLLATVPGHRLYDVFREDDLVEEIARRHGYDSFPDHVRPYRPSSVPSDAVAALEDRVRTVLVGLGFLEARSMTLVPSDQGDVALLLPLSSTESRLRRALVPGLIHRVEANFNRGARDVRMFEIGTVFAPGGGDGLPHESNHLAVILTGARAPAHWAGAAEAVDLWDLRGVLETLADELGLVVEPASSSSSSAWLDPALAWHATRRAQAEIVAWGGRVRAQAVDAPAWAGDVFALEMNLTGLSLGERVEYRALPAFPAIERDLALLLPRELPAARALDTIRAAGGEFLEAVWPFDLYQGAGLPAGRRSVAFRLRFRAPHRTLTDEEIDSQVGRVLKRLRDEHDVQRRG